MISDYEIRDSTGANCGREVFDTLGEKYRNLCFWFEGNKNADYNAVFDVEGRAVYIELKGWVDQSKMRICGADKTEIDKIRKTIESFFETRDHPVKLVDK